MNNNWTKGCDFGFKVGQRAWHVRFGWGTIVSVENHERFSIGWSNDSCGYVFLFMIDGCEYVNSLYPTIFHVEQTFDFSRPEWQPEPGELCWVWYSSDKLPTLAKFHRMNTNLYRCFNMSNLEVDYKYCAPFNGGKLPDEFKQLLLFSTHRTGTRVHS